MTQPRVNHATTQRPTKLALNRIVEDHAIQPRFKMSRDAVRRYAQQYRANPKRLPPITVGRIGNSGKLILIDGFHRVKAAALAHLREIPAVIIETTIADAKWLAVEANFANGVPITRAEKRRVFRRFVDAGKNIKEDGSLMSSRELAKALPIGSYQTMLTWMKQDYPAIYANMTGNEPEEEVPEGDAGSREEDQALSNVEWAESQYLAAIRKAAQVVPKESIAVTVGDIKGRIEGVLGVPNLSDLLPEDFDCDDF